MRNREGSIGIIGIILIILIVCVILGKTSAWHIMLFPVYVILGLVLAVAVILGIIYLVIKFLDR